jgi:hypothetical protein
MRHWTWKSIRLKMVLSIPLKRKEMPVING